MPATGVIGQPGFTSQYTNYESSATMNPYLFGTDFVETTVVNVSGTNYVYSVAGRDSNFNVTQVVGRATINGSNYIGPWSTSGQTQLPVFRWEGSLATVSVGGTTYLYYIGGRDENSSYHTEVYRAALDSSGNVGSWSTTGQSALPVALVTVGHTFIANVGGTNYIYLVGGRNSSATPVNTVYRATIDGSGNIGSWATTGQGQLPQATAFSVLSTIVIGGTRYVYDVGGSADNSNAKTTVYKATIDGSGNISAWTTVGQGQLSTGLMFYRGMATTDGVNNALFTFGGVVDNGSSNPIATVYKAPLDNSGNVGTWTTSGQTALPRGLDDFGFATFTSGATSYAYIIGGQFNLGTNVGSVIRMTISGLNVTTAEAISVTGSAQGFIFPEHSYFDGSKFFATDFSTSRIVIYNSVPTGIAQAADIVVGQPNFTSFSSNPDGSVTARGLSQARDIASTGTKLIATDESNNRVLIWNTIPTSNFTPADVVIGQSSMTTSGTGTSSTTYNLPISLAYDPASGKLAVCDDNNNRILIYNSIPTTNGAAADVVVGQPDFTSSGIGTTRTSLNFPYSVRIFNGKLLVNDNSNNRILIWNSIPTTNNAPADVVIGQTDFTSGSANQGGSAAANTINNVSGMYYDGKYLFVSEFGNNRVLVFDGIPTSNNPSAIKVIGQPDFTSTSVNQGNTTANSRSLSSPADVWGANNYIFVSDSGNSRILSYYDDSITPTVTPTPPISATPAPGTGSSFVPNPNKKEGWKEEIQAGPNHSGDDKWIYDDNVPDVKVFISKEAVHDDVHLFIKNLDWKELLLKQPVVPYPWSQGINAIGGLLEIEAVSAFNGYAIPQFDGPVSLTIPYDPLSLKGRNPAALRIYIFDPASRKWKVNNAPVVVDAVHHTLSTTTKQLGYITIGTGGYYGTPAKVAPAKKATTTPKSTKKN